MAEVIGCVEGIERPFAQLVEVQVMLLLGVVMGPEDKDAGPRLGAHHIIHDPSVLTQIVGIIGAGLVDRIDQQTANLDI